MKSKGKIKIGSLPETLTEITALALPSLLDPDITSNPLPLIVKTLQSLGSHYLSRLFIELKEKLNKKEIKKDNFNTEKPLLSFQELIKTINSGAIDEDKFRALKSIFFYGIAKNADKMDEFWSYEFLQTANNITGTEVLILKANFDIVNGKRTKEVQDTMAKNLSTYSRAAWRNVISLQMGLSGFNSLVGKYEENLEKLGLISPRNYDNRFSGDFEPTSKHRLTEMGYKFCEFMSKYE